MKIQYLHAAEPRARLSTSTLESVDAGVAESPSESLADSVETEPPSRGPRPLDHQGRGLEDSQQRGRSRLRRDLRCSVKDCTAYSVMVGMGETYIPAFVLALGLGEIAAGMAASVPMLLGAILQIASPWAAARIGSNRRWVITCVLVQAASFLPLIAAALLGYASVVYVFGTVAIYWAASQGSSPAWNSWMETVVPNRVRAGFFALRTRLGQAGILLGFLVGGLTLQYGKTHGNLLTCFAALFAISAVCRCISAQYLFRQHEAPARQRPQRHVSPWEIWQRIYAGGSERTLLYFLAVQVAVQTSGPYFTPYMLKQLHLSYVEFVSLLATSFLGKIVVLPAMGRFARRFGTRQLLWLGGIGIVPVSGLWLYCDTLPEMIALQFLAGAVWAAYELAMFLLFFESIRPDERTSILTSFNLANATCLCIGALIGGVTLKALGESPEAYVLIFVLSSVFRSLALVVLRLMPEVKPVAVASEPEAELEVAAESEPVVPPALVAPLPVPEPKLRQVAAALASPTKTLTAPAKVLSAPATVSAPSR